MSARSSRSKSEDGKDALEKRHERLEKMIEKKHGKKRKSKYPDIRLVWYVPSFVSLGYAREFRRGIFWRKFTQAPRMGSNPREAELSLGQWCKRLR